VAGLGVDKVVHVQAADPGCGPVAETAWLQSLADRHGWPNAIVAPCALAAPGAPGELADQAAFGAWRGVRDTGDPDLIGTEGWLTGFEALVKAGGSVDLMVSRDHFDQVLAVARRHPEATVVLEHAGAPVVSKLDSYFEEWRAGLTRLATAPNVVCKVSALSSMALPSLFTDSIARWVRTCLDTFGIERCFFSSNWPMDALFTSFPRLLAAFRGVVEDLAPAEQARLFASNAEAVYRI
jgi:predicted TIM-barrel fold metal-dependent hydrolase